MGLSNAERQERWRIKRAKEIEALRKAAAKPALPLHDTETAALHTEIHRLRRELILAVGARQEPAKAKPQPARWQTPAKRISLPKDMEGYFAKARWLRGHRDRVIEIIVAPSFTGDPLDRAEQWLAERPGVYRIARIVGGSFGSEGDDLRRQVRALMAVTERALQAEALPGAWSGGIVVYDPRASVM